MKKALPKISITQLMNSPKLFGNYFKDESWSFWKAFAASLFGEPLTDEQLAIYRKYTKRENPPTSPVREAYCVIGRRGGKSLVASLAAIYVSCFRNHDYLKGETGTCMVLAADRRQCRTIMKYILNFMQSVPLLKAQIESTTTESIRLVNGINIEIQTSNFRLVRGYTCVCAIADEIAYWRDETSANPDVEVLRALRPAMATVRDPLLLCISSPYSRRGALWDAYKNHFGKDDSATLVWQAPTIAANPNVDESIIDAAYAEDLSSASAEYGATFRSDLESYVDLKQIESLVVTGRRELPYQRIFKYHAFCDPSGGRADSYTMAIAHREKDRIVLDLVREHKAPFNPDAVTAEYSQILRSYDIRQIQSDKYGGEFPVQAFAKSGIRCVQSAESKSTIYRECLAIFNTNRCELLDNAALVTQISRLERRTSKSGSDQIDHPSNSRDDIANVACGVILMCAGQGQREATGGKLFKVGDPRWLLGGSRRKGPSRPFKGPSILF
jgi:hypothetical protein